MPTHAPFPPVAASQAGTSLLEVLVAIVVVALGLLGLAGLQAKIQVADLEAYQRTQAIMLMEDMASRLMANKLNAALYTGVPAALTTSIMLGTPGTGVTNQPDDCSTISNPTRQKLDNCEWSNALKGAAETSGTSKLGAMIGARGCIKKTGSVIAGEYTRMEVTVVWQGNSSTAAPPTNLSCGQGLYNTGCPSNDDRCRRAVSTTITTYNPLN